ncbi:MAG TPA: hypothetical protein VFZ21_08385, partial [Gemmatimonadaceae bacterium]|nr:hypothetical protein [Gemmatimonadaceae bacterium]
MTMLAPLMMLVVFGCRQAPVGTAERRSSEPGGAVVVDWSKLAYEIAFAEDSFRTFKGQRAFAMMHLAMHDAINGVIPRYRQFLFHGRDTLASPVVAAAVAARGVLVSQYPNVAARLDAELARALASTTDSAAASRGRSLGRLSANAVLAARADDGWDVGGSYVFDDRIGAYRTTPPWNGFVVQPGFRYARPFGLTEPGQFRPGPPPALESQAYA